MTTDWRRLLTSQGISFKDERRNLYVQCPFCGSADSGQYMGISTEGRGYGCWRNRSHRGKSEVVLLAAILRVDMGRAASLLGARYSGLNPDGEVHSQVLANLTATPLKTPLQPAPAFPKGIKPLWGPATRERAIFYDYLTERGYQPSYLPLLCEMYHLHYAMSGPFAYRLIFPVYDQEGLITWTGRSVSQNTMPRYLTLSVHANSKLVEQGMPLAAAPITDMLFQEDRLFQIPCDTLIICEGPFDAMRVDFAHIGKDVAATCLFGKTLSAKQIDKIAELSSYSTHKFLLLDPDAKLDLFALSATLNRFGFLPINLPDQYEDPGDKRLGLSTIRQIIEGALGQ